MKESKYTPTVFMHIKDIKKEKKIKNFCRRNGWNVRMVEERDKDKSVGALAFSASRNVVFGKDVSLNANGVKAPDGYEMPEFLVFCGFSSEVLDKFLEEYKKENLPSVSLKAVLTQTNAEWSFYQLVQELERERKAYIMAEE